LIVIFFSSSSSSKNKPRRITRALGKKRAREKINNKGEFDEAGLMTVGIVEIKATWNPKKKKKTIKQTAENRSQRREPPP
jgi:hypothetical protein